MSWQLLGVVLAITAAACYVGRAAWRAWSARPAGCAGGCGCGGVGPTPDPPATFIPADRLTVRARR